MIIFVPFLLEKLLEEMVRGQLTSGLIHERKVLYIIESTGKI